MYAPNTSYPSSDVEMLACGFSHPDEIVRDNSLSLDEKRELLADWASDIRSIKDHPTYRLIDSGQVLSLAEILKAIADLEQQESTPSERLCRSDDQNENRKKPKSSDDDDPDDDPPPVPAGVFVPLPPNPPTIPELAF